MPSGGTISTPRFRDAKAQRGFRPRRLGITPERFFQHPITGRARLASQAGRMLVGADVRRRGPDSLRRPLQGQAGEASVLASRVRVRRPARGSARPTHPYARLPRWPLLPGCGPTRRRLRERQRPHTPRRRAVGVRHAGAQLRRLAHGERPQRVAARIGGDGVRKVRIHAHHLWLQERSPMTRERFHQSKQTFCGRKEAFPRAKPTFPGCIRTFPRPPKQTFPTQKKTFRVQWISFRQGVDMESLWQNGGRKAANW